MQFTILSILPVPFFLFAVVLKTSSIHNKEIDDDDEDGDHDDDYAIEVGARWLQPKML